MIIATPVQKELKRIAADYRRWRMLRRLMACWTAVGLLALLLSAVYYSTGFAVPFIVPILIVLALGLAVWAWRDGGTQVAIREVAQRVERDDPALNSLLLAAMEQQPDPKTGKLSLMQLRVIREALDANRRSPWAQKVSSRLRMAHVAHLAALIFLVTSIFSMTRSGPASSSSRSFSHEVQSLEISPGNIELERGSSLAVMAKFAPNDVPKGAKLLIKRAGGQQTLDLMKSLQDPIFGATLPEVREHLSYVVEYDGKKSAEYKVTVFDYPELTGSDAALEYPAYTRLEPKSFQDTRRVSAVEQTKIDYTYRFNKPLAVAELISRDGKKIGITNAPGENVWKSLFQLKESGIYSLHLKDQEGRTNKVPMEFHFVALTNSQPKLKFVTPKGDQRVSPLHEMEFAAEAEDDFGLQSYGFAYQVPGRDGVVMTLGQSRTNLTGVQKFNFTLPLESLNLEPGELVSYYAWADDIGPDGKARRNAGEMFFAEIRPFDEIFREGQGDSSSSSEQQQQGGQQSPSQKLAELQKEVVSATWNLKRRVGGGLPPKELKSDSKVIEESENQALEMVQELKGRGGAEKYVKLVNSVEADLKKALGNLQELAGKGNVTALDPALTAEQSAYQTILKMQAREFEVNRSRQQQAGGGGGGNANERQLDELEFNQEENKYESESQASEMPQGEQREALQVLNRLKELARRQNDMSERLKELQAALNEAKSEQEKEELRRQLKRLQEEQQQIVEDMDDVRQRMSRPENQSKMAEAQKQLEQTRQQARETAEEMREGDVGQALTSSTRAQRELQEMSEDLRKATSKQFSEEMRRMREQAREMEKRQQQIAEKMDQMKEGAQQRPLSETGPKQQILDQLAQQKSALTNILQNMRNVTEKAEASEPLLSRQLYETFRKSSQAQPEKSLDLTTQLVERNFLPDAEKIEERASQAIKDIKTGVEKAAQDLLGDDTAALRAASNELNKLAEKLEREIASNTAVGSTNGAAGSGERASNANNTNRVASASGSGESRGSTNSTERAQGGEGTGSGERPNGEQLAGNDQRNPAAGEGQSQEGQPGEGSPGNQENTPPGEGQGRGQNRQLAQNGQNPGQQPGQGQQPGEGGQEGSQPGSGGGRGENPQQPREGQDAARGNNRGNRLASSFNRGGGGDGRNNGGGFEGPLTGTDFTQWADRLRDVEEMLDAPDLRADAARVLDRAREVRSEFKRHAEPPKWDLVRHEVLKPMQILQTRINEELSKRQSTASLVPIDRDPVPAKFSELVSKYYENLGRSTVPTNAPTVRR